MAVNGEDTDFDDFVGSRSRGLLKVAWLLTGDWPLAEDLLQAALAKCYLAWPRIGAGRHEAYVRRTLVTTYATWWRRKWRAERPSGDLPPVAVGDETSRVELRRVLVDALAGLSRGQRAVVVLRYYCDLPEAEVAEALGCSVGTVKSQAARGLARLRESGLADELDERSRR